MPPGDSTIRIRPADVWVEAGFCDAALITNVFDALAFNDDSVRTASPGCDVEPLGSRFFVMTSFISWEVTLSSFP